MSQEPRDDPAGFIAKMIEGSFYAVLAPPFDNAAQALRFAAFVCRAQNLRGFALGVDRALGLLQSTDPEAAQSSLIDYVMRRLEAMRDDALTDLAGMSRRFTEAQLACLKMSRSGRN